MKTRSYWNWCLGLGLAAWPLFTGCDPAQSASAAAAEALPPATVTTDQDPSEADVQAAQQKMENAPGQIVSTPDANPTFAPASVTSGGPLAEIVKLAQSGVDESVMLAYVNNSTAIINLSSDDIVYLNDIGVPGTVVTAIMQHDQVLKSNPATVAVTAPTAPTAPLAPNVPNAPVSPYAPPADTAVQAPPAVVEGASPAATYFYDSLAPYGNWISIEGYGLCWQPTAVVVNQSWQPYGDYGHWVYSDCGWYWASDYSWGWAPFHYGRWFRHARWGWCWAPDTVWGPSWVSWRYADDYCGWAPLPPWACYSPGVGFTYYGRGVSFSFSFGIRPSCFTFVSIGNFCDPHPWRHRVPHHNVINIYNHTTIINRYGHEHNHVYNHGIPVARVEGAVHRPIRPMHIRETADSHQVTRGEHLERDGRTLTVFHPNLPQPSGTRNWVGQGIRPARHDERITQVRGTPVINRDADTIRNRFGSGSQDRRSSPPVFHNDSTRDQGGPNRLPRDINTSRDSSRDNNNRDNNSRGFNSSRDNTVTRDNNSTRDNNGSNPRGSLILRGSDRSNGSANPSANGNPNPNMSPRGTERNNRPIFTPSQTPADTQNPSPRQNDRVPPRDNRQYTQPYTPPQNQNPGQGQRNYRPDQPTYSPYTAPRNDNRVYTAPTAPREDRGYTPSQRQTPAQNYPSQNYQGNPHSNRGDSGSPRGDAGNSSRSYRQDSPSPSPSPRESRPSQTAPDRGSDRGDRGGGNSGGNGGDRGDRGDRSDRGNNDRGDRGNDRPRR